MGQFAKALLCGQCAEESLQERAKGLMAPVARLGLFGHIGLILYFASFSLSIQPMLPSVKTKGSLRGYLPSEPEEVNSLLPVPCESTGQVIHCPC